MSKVCSGLAHADFAGRSTRCCTTWGTTILVVLVGHDKLASLQVKSIQTPQPSFQLAGCRGRLGRSLMLPGSDHFVAAASDSEHDTLRCRMGTTCTHQKDQEGKIGLGFSSQSLVRAVILSAAAARDVQVTTVLVVSSDKHTVSAVFASVLQLLAAARV
jgi:hypothetical protein